MSNFSEFVRIVDSVCISQGERASPSAVFCCSNLSAISFNVLCNQKCSSAHLDCNKCCCVGFVWSWSSLAGLLWHQLEFFIQRTAALFPLCQTLLCKPRREITADQQLLKHSDSWSGTNNHAMWLVSPFFTITITTQIHEKKKKTHFSTNKISCDLDGLGFRNKTKTQFLKDKRQTGNSWSQTQLWLLTERTHKIILLFLKEFNVNTKSISADSALTKTVKHWNK